MGGSIFCLVLIVLVLVPLILISNSQRKAQEEAARRLQAANDAYRSALAKLKANPTDPNLKEETLRLGRAYAAMSREQKAATIYDEMALMNDINAATAGATKQASVESVEDRLRKLADLQVKGLISADEYAERRKRLIEEV
jgi:hypothetical protein